MTITADFLARRAKIDRARQGCAWIAAESNRLSAEANYELSQVRRILRELATEEDAQIAFRNASVPSRSASPVRGRVGG